MSWRHGRIVPVVLTALLLAAASSLLRPNQVSAQQRPLRIIVFGAHPDDADETTGGTAALWAAKGHAVKFVAMTNGDAGHQSEGGGALGRRRRAEAQESARRLGIAEYQVIDNHDGELLPTLAAREQVIRAIRGWKADLVLAPRPNDYHPDHRYTGVLVQDAAYMVVVPNVAPDTPPLHDNPVFMYVSDHFQRPNPFRPDVAVAIDSVWDRKISGLDAHVSQVYEWLPWVSHTLESVPKDPAARLAWLKTQWHGYPVNDAVRAALRKWYGAKADGVKNAEAFEVCEYGKQPSEAELRQLFPFFD
ncbi:MAG TPA: PIG-L family deacetylase [Vicinamibacteria bacterium]|nr:PIG-L family deacetylase [Vicinamibacteria bacterium]